MPRRQNAAAVSVFDSEYVFVVGGESMENNSSNAQPIMMHVRMDFERNEMKVNQEQVEWCDGTGEWDGESVNFCEVMWEDLKVYTTQLIVSCKRDCQSLHIVRVRKDVNEEMTAAVSRLWKAEFIGSWKASPLVDKNVNSSGFTVLNGDGGGNVKLLRVYASLEKSLRVELVDSTSMETVTLLEKDRRENSDKCAHCPLLKKRRVEDANESCRIADLVEKIEQRQQEFEQLLYKVQEHSRETVRLLSGVVEKLHEVQAQAREK
uniref:Uncharacterized protein n=1 Tax=Timspurckia oligopyrenoides TaxID=708627 RepID=A0A7S0ZHM9_9RHOD